MEHVILTKVAPETVWSAWEKANGQIVAGMKGVRRGFRYQILEVEKGRSFSVLWKSLLTRLVFFHQVVPHGKGSEIRYSFAIKGPFKWVLARLLQKKVQASLTGAMQAMVKQLESN